MYEAIVTIIVHGDESEPSHTEVLRFEFESEENMRAFFDSSERDELVLNEEALRA